MSGDSGHLAEIREYRVGRWIYEDLTQPWSVRHHLINTASAPDVSPPRLFWWDHSWLTDQEWLAETYDWRAWSDPYCCAMRQVRRQAVPCLVPASKITGCRCSAFLQEPWTTWHLGIQQMEVANRSLPLWILYYEIPNNQSFQRVYRSVICRDSNLPRARAIHMTLDTNVHNWKERLFNLMYIENSV